MNSILSNLLQLLDGGTKPAAPAAAPADGKTPADPAKGGGFADALMKAQTPATPATQPDPTVPTAPTTPVIKGGESIVLGDGNESPTKPVPVVDGGDVDLPVDVKVVAPTTPKPETRKATSDKPKTKGAPVLDDATLVAAAQLVQPQQQPAKPIEGNAAPEATSDTPPIIAATVALPDAPAPMGADTPLPKTDPKTPPTQKPIVVDGPLPEAPTTAVAEKPRLDATKPPVSGKPVEGKKLAEPKSAAVEKATDAPKEQQPATSPLPPLPKDGLDDARITLAPLTKPQAQTADAPVPTTSAAAGKPEAKASTSVTTATPPSPTDASDAVTKLRLATQAKPKATAPVATKNAAGDTPPIIATTRSEDSASPDRFAPAPTSATRAPAVIDVPDPVDPASTPGQHRADVTIGEGDQRIVVSVMASEHQVRVHARAATPDDTAALRAGGDELRGALKKHGLELAYLNAETGGSGNQTMQRGSSRETEKETQEARQPGAQRRNSEEKDNPEATREGVRVLA